MNHLSVSPTDYWTTDILLCHVKLRQPDSSSSNCADSLVVLNPPTSHDSYPSEPNTKYLVPSRASVTTSLSLGGAGGYV